MVPARSAFLLAALVAGASGVAPARAALTAASPPAPPSGTAAAATADAAAPREKLTLRDAIHRALAQNFDLAAERSSAAAAAARLDSASAAYLPTLTFSARATDYDTPGETGAGGATSLTNSFSSSVATDARETSLSARFGGRLPSGATYSATLSVDDTSGTRTLGGATADFESASGTLAAFEITQPLLRDRAIDQTRLTLRQRRVERRRSAAQLRLQALETVAAVETAYHDLVAADALVEVRASTLALSEQNLADTLARLSIGTRTELDERQLRAEVAGDRAALLAARQTRRERQNALKQLVLADYAAERATEWAPADALTAPTEDEPAPDYAASLARALAARPELATSGDDIELAREDLAFARDRLKPSLDLGGGLGYRAADREVAGLWSQFSDRRYPYYEVGLTFSFPWDRRGARADIRAARESERRARLRLAQTEQSIRTETDDAVAAVESARLRTRATASASEFAEAALAAATDRLSFGTTTSYEVLQRRRDFASARADAITALADYHKALARLRRVEATTLEHWGLQISTAAEPAAPSP